MDELPERLTLDEAAQATGYTTRHLRRLMRLGEITAVDGEKPITRKQPVWMIPREEIARLRERRRGAKTEPEV